jgi:hypothetical protein
MLLLGCRCLLIDDGRRRLLGRRVISKPASLLGRALLIATVLARWRGAVTLRRAAVPSTIAATVILRRLRRISTSRRSSSGRPVLIRVGRAGWASWVSPGRLRRSLVGVHIEPVCRS